MCKPLFTRGIAYRASNLRSLAAQETKNRRGLLKLKIKKKKAPLCVLRGKGFSFKKAKKFKYVSVLILLFYSVKSKEAKFLSSL